MLFSRFSKDFLRVGQEGKSLFFSRAPRFLVKKKKQGLEDQGVWVLAAKLPNSGVNFAVDFWVDFILLFFPKENFKKAPKIHKKKSPEKIHPGLCSEKFASDVCRSLLLKFRSGKTDPVQLKGRFKLVICAKAF